ncbi:MAG TPA: PAS domain-containing protein [Arenibaculum sp.]|nr:PAS domain-containing protein [Arenibaculum sp.]
MPAAANTGYRSATATGKLVAALRPAEVSARARRGRAATKASGRVRMPGRDKSEAMDTILTAAFDYWRSKLGGRAMPARRDLDPLDIPKLLPWLMLTDVLRNPLDFRYRLIGTEIAARARRDYTGRRFSELTHTGPSSQVWIDRARVVETCRPVFTTPPYTGGDDSVSAVSGIHMPLSDDASSVNMILSVVTFQTRRQGGGT